MRVHPSDSLLKDCSYQYSQTTHDIPEQKNCKIFITVTDSFLNLNSKSKRSFVRLGSVSYMTFNDMPSSLADE